MNKYAPLGKFLSEKGFDRIPMTFDEIESVVGDRFPASARKHRAWWSNSIIHSQAIAWTGAGYRTAEVSLEGEKLTFVRDREFPKPANDRGGPVGAGLAAGSGPDYGEWEQPATDTRMPSVAFDTLKAARRLGDAGFSQEQAETLVGTFAEGITENLATKDDIVRLEEKIDTSFKTLDAKIDTSFKTLDAKIDTSFKTLDAKIDTSFKTLDAKIDTSAEALDAKIDTSFKTLDAKIDTSFKTLDAKIDTSFKTLDAKIDTSFKALDAKIDTSAEALKKDMTIRLGSLIVLGIGVMIGLERLLG